MAIITTKGYEILMDSAAENVDGYFECDELIAPTIALLNKKGYTTKNCCSGHPYEDIGNMIIHLQEEDKDLTPFQIREKYDLYTVSPKKNEDGTVNVTKRDAISLFAYIDFASYVKLPSIPEGFDFNGRMLRQSMSDFFPEESEDNEEDAEKDYFWYFEKRLSTMKRLYDWAESLPDYETIITENDKKEREFETVTAPKILDEYLIGYGKLLADPEVREGFIEYADDELFYLTTNDMSTDTVRYVGFVSVPVDEKEDYFRSRLQKFVDGEDDHYELSCDRWTREFDDTQEMYEYMKERIKKPDHSSKNPEEIAAFEKDFDEFLEDLESASSDAQFLCLLLNDYAEKYFEERDFSVKII